MKMTKLLFPLLLLLAVSGRLNADKESDPVETKIRTIMVDPNTESPVVVLETVTDKKLIPIWIDVPEARAIALELEHVTTPRPLTHDLIRDILNRLGAKLQRVTITDIRNNTYFALLSLEFKGQALEIDSRPSDAIALATRMKAPIYAATQVLEKSKGLPTQSGSTEPSLKTLELQAQDLTEELAALLDLPVRKGVLVADVAPGGLAMTAGMQRGDIITKANDQTIQSAHELEAIIRAIKPPAKLKLEVIKKGKPTIIMIDLPS